MFLGVVLGGLLASYMSGYMELMMSVGLLIGGVAVALAPWYPHLGWLCWTSAGDGLARGMLSIGKYRVVAASWVMAHQFDRLQQCVRIGYKSKVDR